MAIFLLWAALVILGADCARLKFHTAKDDAKTAEQLCGKLNNGYCEVDIVKEYGLGKEGESATYSGGRSGYATETHSCDHIRAVPSHLTWITRHNFYRKYTEAYGIPVISSWRVKDEALKKACFIVRFLYADRKDTRQAMYSNYGRVGVIAESEGTTSIPEHSHLPAWWNQRARGLGAMVGVPISTGGEENLLCLQNDRYRGDDIFFHEASHSVAELAIRSGSAPVNNFYARLQSAYANARRTGLWANTYAIDTVREYFAEGAQSFHNCHIGYARANGIHGPIKNRALLRTYDYRLYSLLEEIWPCKNYYPCLCSTKKTTLRMNCDGKSTQAPNTDAKTDDSKPNPPTQPPIPKTTAAPNPNCVDKDTTTNCQYWKNTGECTRSAAWMKANCCKSCCYDSNSRCAEWAGRGECTKNPAYMLTSCKKSCNNC